MPEIFFPAQNLSPETFLRGDKSALASFERNNSLACQTLTANMPYCLPGAYSEGRIITQTLSNLPTRARENLMCTIDTFGDFTTTLAAFYHDQLAFLNLQNTAGLVGAGATASETRLTKFQTELVNYQKALHALNNNTRVGRVAGAQRAELRARVHVSYENLQRSYHAELNKLASANSLGKNRGNALSSAERGVTLAERHRGRGINVANNAQALQIAQLSKHISLAGKSMVALDAGLRMNGVHNTYQQGGDWQREAALQATGFGLGGAAGIKVGTSVVAGLTALGLGLTPVGWVVLIGIGVAAGFATAYQVDKISQGATGWIYDRGH